MFSTSKSPESDGLAKSKILERARIFRLTTTPMGGRQGIDPFKDRTLLHTGMRAYTQLDRV